MSSHIKISNVGILFFLYLLPKSLGDEDGDEDFGKKYGGFLKFLALRKLYSKSILLNLEEPSQCFTVYSVCCIRQPVY